MGVAVGFGIIFLSFAKGQRLGRFYNAVIDKLAVAQISYYDSRLGASEENVARQQELLDVGAASEADLLKARMEVVRIRIKRLQKLIELSSAYYIAAYLGS